MNSFKLFTEMSCGILFLYSFLALIGLFSLLLSLSSVA